MFPDTGLGVAPGNNFSEIFRKLPPEQQPIMNALRSGNNPQAGADFLATNSSDTIPLLFTILASEDTPQQAKVATIDNIRSALVNPSSSGLARKIPGEPDEFFARLVEKATRARLDFFPTQEAQRYVQLILANFQTGLANAPAKTLAGENPDILRKGAYDVDEHYLLEAAIVGVLDRKLPANFRETLLRTLLFVGSTRPEIFSRLASYRSIPVVDLVPKIVGRETPEERERRLEGERQQELLRARSQVSAVEHELQVKIGQIERLKQDFELERHGLQGNIVDRDRLIQQLERDLQGERATVRTLEALLAQARAQGAPRTTERARGKKTPFEALEIPNTATEEQIRHSYRDLSQTFHPDAIDGVLEKTGIPERRRKGFKTIAEERMKEINEAFDSLKGMGRVR